MRTHVLIDRMDETPAVNRLECTCGVEIHPDCDVSTTSICEAFEDHLRRVNPSELDEWQLSIISQEASQ